VDKQVALQAIMAAELVEPTQVEPEEALRVAHLERRSQRVELVVAVVAMELCHM